MTENEIKEVTCLLSELVGLVLKLGIGKIGSFNTSRARRLLRLLLMRLHMVGYLSILFREDADDTSCYFVTFIVLSDDVNTKFLEYIQDRNAIMVG